MNPVKKQIHEHFKDSIKNYPFSKHRALIAICCDADCFVCEDENGNVPDPDFEEITVFLERKWLFKLMKLGGIKHPKRYLRDEYTSDDSVYWIEQANADNKIAMISCGHEL